MHTIMSIGVSVCALYVGMYLLGLLFHIIWEQDILGALDCDILQ